MYFVNRRWKNRLSSALKINDRLSIKQSMIQYINSNGSFRRWCRNNAERNRIFGCKTAQSPDSMRMAIQQEQLSTELYGVCSMEVSQAYAAINGGRKHVDVNIFHLNPFEQICVTFEKSINQGPLLLRNICGRKTVIINFGSDKCDDVTA